VCSQKPESPKRAIGVDKATGYKLLATSYKLLATRLQGLQEADELASCPCLFGSAALRVETLNLFLPPTDTEYFFLLLFMRRIGGVLPVPKFARHANAAMMVMYISMESIC
jgi:hypothetical protein